MIFNESKFQYKKETSSEPVGKDITTDFINLASILQSIEEGYCLGFIQHNDQIEQRHPNTPEPKGNPNIPKL